MIKNSADAESPTDPPVLYVKRLAGGAFAVASGPPPTSDRTRADLVTPFPEPILQRDVAGGAV